MTCQLHAGGCLVSCKQRRDVPQNGIAVLGNREDLTVIRAELYAGDPFGMACQDKRIDQLQWISRLL